LKRSLLGLTVGPVTLYQPVASAPAGRGRKHRRAPLPEGQVAAEPVEYDLSTNVDGLVSVWGLPPWPVTMIGRTRLDNVERCLRRVLEEGIPGDVIETGVWKGGTTIFMRGVLRAFGVTDRRVYVADSFEGLPEPDVEKYPADEGMTLHLWRNLAVGVDEVKANFARYDLLDDQVEFVEGWFRDTLPGLREHAWSVVRLDGDYYESTMDALVNLYPGLSPGGWLIIDDHDITACAQAVSDYRERNGIDEPIERIDWTGICWQKRR
jgi:hypothetical protein